MPSRFGKKKKQHHDDGAPANTKIGPKRVKEVDTRGGNSKTRAFKLDHGNFSWASEGVTRKTRIANVVYNASDSNLVRTNTLVKGAIVLIDAAPFALWRDQSSSGEVDDAFEEQLRSSRLHARIASRPGQCGRADGYILEGEELRFYLKKIYGHA